MSIGPVRLRRRVLRAAVGSVCLLLLALAWGPRPVSAEEVEDVFGGLGTATTVDDTDLTAGLAAGEGAIEGQVFDGELGIPVGGVTVILIWPDPGDGSEPRQEVQVTNAEGEYAFTAVPEGGYRLSFVKSGFRASAMTDFVVAAGQVNRADFPLPPLPPETSGEVLQLEAFVVEATTVGEMMDSLEMRMESDELLNIMSSEDLARYAASDVGEALKRVAGVNVVEGQFAIIRGLEDRYSSTLYNGAPVPSPDPDRQSVQLDLFPSEVVSNLVVAKTFGPHLPSNSSGGSIDIITTDYPEQFTGRINGGVGLNDRAVGRYIELNEGNPVGNEQGEKPVNLEFGASLGGRGEVLDRELRYKVVFNWDRDFKTAAGFKQSREPQKSVFRRLPRPGRIVESGDLSLGELNLTGGLWDLTQSEREEQTTGYLGLGIDLDQEGRHRLDGSIFYTRKNERVVQVRENGFLPGNDYEALAERQQNGLDIQPSNFTNATPTTWLRFPRQSPEESAQNGPLWFTNFNESRSFLTERDLLVTQLNGRHEFEGVEGLEFDWAGNFATTQQTEDVLGLGYFYEPDDRNQTPTVFPTTPQSLGPGEWAARNQVLSSSVDIDEDQYFFRLGGDYETPVGERVELSFTAGGWFEGAQRDVVSSFLESPSVDGESSQFAVFAETPEQLGENVFAALDRDPDTGLINGSRLSTNDSERQIFAGSFGSKATLFDYVDVLGGLRLERILIVSNNDPFTGEDALDGTPDIFPTKYLFFDRLDNPARNEVVRPPPEGTVFNDQILGVPVPVDPVTGLVDLVDRQEIEEFVNGKIDEFRVLPSAGFAIRPIEGMSLKGAWSQTVARPSFREMGFYVSTEPGTDDLIVGNPQLQLSDVQSWDLRFEYNWGDLGDLFAVSGFYKTIKDPIESIVVRNPLNAEASSSALFRTFFNNPNQAYLGGVEVEARKNLGFLRHALRHVTDAEWWNPNFGEYISFGGNYTYIDAKVKRIEEELGRADPFFGVAEGDFERFSELAPSRRLFGQPKWIANVDASFDHPIWGTKITLAYFAISDILDAAGSAAIGPNGEVVSFELDRYIDRFETLDLVISQRIPVPLLRGDVTLKFTAKNLTDSLRKVVYDPGQTANRISEREFRVGRSYKLSLGFAF